MKNLSCYSEIADNEDSVFNYIINNLRHSNRTFDYFIDWSKVFQKVESIEIELNLLNYLIGKDNIKVKFKELIKRSPDIVNVIPILVAIRKKSVEVLVDYKNDWEYQKFNFRKKKNYSDEEIDKIIEFCDGIGLLELFEKKKIKNIVDYMIGLEVGIGTNGRKNRSGILMEKITGWYIEKECKKLELEYIEQASKKKIKKQWGIETPVDKSSRRYDFAIKKEDKVVLIETNFYTTGGSKLKSVAGEYISLNNLLKNKKSVEAFVWITDGKGWETAKRPLRETFDKIDFLLTTKLIENGALEEILN
ncbi:MAG: type II restriction endonuclease [Bacillota bacterium]